MSLAQYLKPLVRMWWLIVAAVAVATLASFVVVRQSPPNYQSHTGAHGWSCAGESQSEQR